MPTPEVLHKRSSTPSATPTPEQIGVGELAINLADKKLFSKDADGNVFEFVYPDPTFEGVQFNTTTPMTLDGAGDVAWNDSEGTLDIRLKGNNVTLQVGQELVKRVVNKTDANLLQSEYKVVRLRTTAEGGAQGQRLTVKLAQANTDSNHSGILGIVTENIDNNQEGFITTYGEVRDINTTGSLQSETWSDGDLLYLSPTVAGGVTNVEPSDHSVTVGIVEHAHATHGKIFVKISNGIEEINKLHDVNITSPQDDDVLTYDSGKWVNKPLPVAASSGAQTFITSGTFTIPTGVESLKVTVVGAGGGGGAGGNVCGAGGGAGGTAIKYLSGLTAGNTLTVTVGTGGAGGTFANPPVIGGTGGTSSVSSGSESITTITATGGSGALGSLNFSTYIIGRGGVGSNGDINITGNAGTTGVSGTRYPLGGTGGAGYFGGAGASQDDNNSAQSGSNGGGGGGSKFLNSGASGGNGIIIFEW